MNKQTRGKQLVFASLVPIVILLGMCFTPLYTLMTGKEIILQTIPVDPSDLFRGDYVTLRYEAEEVPKELVEAEVLDELKDGRGEIKVYVTLVKKNGIDTPVKVSLVKPEAGTLYLKGTLDYIGDNRDQKEVAFIQYSLDKYFVEDNTGTDWEAASTKGKILAKVKVKNGYAILTGIKKSK
ncbi:GDYXXLXY domain-containing protein [Neobacillus niacini]|uniref:GDYXXLXY domain-containing protein n=1 Tax=Neobacillus niacini TaxID=86668 RepID=UPI002854E14E|nr:GDYXXLXY domain-containing protein [Neobacillus niacini]MDR7001259.1 putative membrane-anchored protein [Neobacillus niacini]